MRDYSIITGGAGFIGSHLAQHLIQRGQRVCVIDDLSTGRRENITPLLGENCQLIHASVSHVLRQQPQVFDHARNVYHLAAAVGVRLIVDDPVTTIRNNIEETAAVLDACKQHQTPVLITSTSEVYGKNTACPLPEHADLHFGPTTASRWSYALSKAIDEHLALAYRQTHQLGAVIVRLFNTIGPRQVGRYGMVVPRFIHWARTHQPIEIYGSGQQTRSFCDVRDVVDACAKLLENPEHHGQIFNVGNDYEVTIEHLARRIIELTGSRSTLTYLPYEQAYQPGFEDPQRRVPDLTRLRAAIGYAPRYTLDDTLRELIALARNDTV